MDYDSNRPIYLQIIEKIKWKIVVGELKPGDKLLSMKDMAVEMSVNPNTMYRVYRELEMEGVAETKRGFGTFVVEDKKIVDKIQDEIINQTIYESVEKLAALGFSDAKIKECFDIALKKIRSKK